MLTLQSRRHLDQRRRLWRLPENTIIHKATHIAGVPYIFERSDGTMLGRVHFATTIDPEWFESHAKRSLSHSYTEELMGKVMKPYYERDRKGQFRQMPRDFHY